MSERVGELQRSAIEEWDSLDAALRVARAQGGDLRALGFILESLQEPLFHHVRIILGDEHEAEDVLQEILLTISRKLGTLRDPRWLRAWAYRIATRAAVRHARRVSRITVAIDSVEFESIPVDDRVERFDPELFATLPDAVAALPPASQIVLRMHYFDGLTHNEVAEALEISVGTVKSRLAYGLGALRKTVKAERGRHP